MTSPSTEPQPDPPVPAAAADRMALLLRVLAVILAGAVLTLLAPPANLHGLHWAVYLPMFWALRADTPKANRWLGWLYGAVGVGLLFRWLAETITLFSNLPSIAAFGVVALFAIVFGAPYALLWGSVHPLRKRLGPGWVLAFPAVAVLLEWASSYLLLFPYNHGVSQYRFPPTWQLVSVTGIWGLTWLLFFVNAVWAEVLYRRRDATEQTPFRWPAASLVGAVALPLLVMAFGIWRFERVEAVLREAPTLRVAQLQSSKDMVHRLREGSRSAFRDWVEMTETLQPGSVDVVVWPEGACPYDLNTGRARDELARLAREGRFEMVVGGGTRERAVDPSMGEERVRIFNSVYFFSPDGEVQTRYDKMVPLPFGEYLPLAEQFPWLADLIEGPGSFRAGDTPVVYAGEQARIATPICYEAILGRVCRLFEQPDLLVNVTNDAWFGDTAAPHQHAMLAAVRAAELGVPLFRSAYTGVSMVIEPHGHIHSETATFADVTQVVTVRMGSVPTIYGRFGDWFVALCALGLGLAWWRTRTRPSGDAGPDTPPSLIEPASRGPSDD